MVWYNIFLMIVGCFFWGDDMKIGVGIALSFCCVGIVLSAPIAVQDASAFHKLNAELNTSVDNPVCMQCHIQEMKTTDVSGLTAWEKPRKIDIPIANIDESGGKADSFSTACLSCHDGNIGSMVMNAPLSPCGLKSKMPVSDKGANHPVFIPYSKAVEGELHPRHSPLKGEWVKAKEVNDLLRDDKVVCVSCHVPHHSSDSGYLRTSQKNSALCLGCHNK